MLLPTDSMATATAANPNTIEVVAIALEGSASESPREFILENTAIIINRPTKISPEVKEPTSGTCISSSIVLPPID